MTRHVTRMQIEDAEHYTPEQRQAIIDSYPEHEKEARIKGIPSLGSGRVFTVAEEKIKCDPFPIPSHWPQMNGLDFGWDHPFAATRNAWDRDDDVWYVIATYREKESTPIIHAAAIKPWGQWIPCAWPHDGLQHDKGSGKQLSALYRDQGLTMLDEHATHELGGTGVEAGVTEMHDRMKTGRFKVFSNLEDWLGEYRLYHRELGIIVKERDDLISSTRYAIMMKRFALTAPKVRALPDHSGMPGAWLG